MIRACPTCETPLPPTKRSNAVYCNRKCKAAAAEKRRPDRDHRARYQAERERRIAYATDPIRMREAAHRRRALERNAERYQFTRRDWCRLVVMEWQLHIPSPHQRRGACDSKAAMAS